MPCLKGFNLQADNLCIGLEHTLTAVLKTQEAKERISGYYEVLISTCVEIVFNCEALIISGLSAFVAGEYSKMSAL